MTEAHREVEKLTLENAQLRVFEAKAALAETQLCLAQIDLKTANRLLDGKVEELRKSELRMDFYWESTDLLKEAIKDALNRGVMVDPVDLMKIIDRPDTEGLF